MRTGPKGMAKFVMMRFLTSGWLELEIQEGALVCKQHDARTEQHCRHDSGPAPRRPLSPLLGTGKSGSSKSSMPADLSSKNGQASLPLVGSADQALMTRCFEIV